MKKLTATFTLLASLAFAGTAFADHDDVRTRDRRSPAPITHQPAFHQPAPIVMPPPAAVRPAWMNARWDTLAIARASQRRGMFKVALPGRGSYDQLRLIASDPRVDILGIELTYARGRTALIRPDRDGLVTVDLGRGKVTSVAVRYVNRGAARGASIKVLAKDDGHGKRRPGRR